MSMVSILSGGVAFVPYAASSDGTAYLAKTSVPSGLSDGKNLTASFWINPASTGTTQSIYGFFTSSARIRIRRISSGTISVFGRDSSGTTILDFRTTNTVPQDAWTHVYICVNMANQAASKIYLNGVSETLVTTTFTDLTLDMTSGSGSWSILSSGDATEIYSGSISEFWMNNSYLDDPGKFASGGKPVNLGPTGAVPTGSQPVFYFSRNGSGNSWNVNAGTGGNMTITGTFGSPTPP